MAVTKPLQLKETLELARNKDWYSVNSLDDGMEEMAKVCAGAEEDESRVAAAKAMAELAAAKVRVLAQIVELCEKGGLTVKSDRRKNAPPTAQVNINVVTPAADSPAKTVTIPDAKVEPVKV